MTRITHRCFLISAVIAGIFLLGDAQESTVSVPSESNSNELSSSSAPDSRVTTVDHSLNTFSKHEDSTLHESVFSSAKPEAESSDGRSIVNGDKTIVDDEHSNRSRLNSGESGEISSSNTDNTQDNSEETTSVATGESAVIPNAEAVSNEEKISSLTNPKTEKLITSRNESVKASVLSNIEEDLQNAIDTRHDTINVIPSENMHESVPFEDDSNRSYVDEKHDSKETLNSSVPLKTNHSGEKELPDAAQNGSQDVSSFHDKETLPSDKNKNSYDFSNSPGTISERESENLSFPQKESDRKEVFITTADSVIESQDSHSTKEDEREIIGSKKVQEIEHLLISTPPATRDISALSVALTSRSDAVHDNTVSYNSFDVSSFSTLSPTPHKISPDRKTSISDVPIGVTFDPDGMTHDGPQDPDSVTFSPVVVHVDESSTNDYVHHSEASQFSHEVPAREREIQPESEKIFPHDEPDFETAVHSSKDSGQASVQPSTESAKKTLPEIRTSSTQNDESEEMLNDSPHVIQSNAGKSFSEHKTEETLSNHNLSKLDVYSNNTSPSLFSSQAPIAPSTKNELVYSNDYRSEQSEVRPVTLATPSKTLDFSTLKPNDVKTEAHTFSVEIVEKPDATTADNLSSIIQPDPAPKTVNESEMISTTAAEPAKKEVNSGKELERDSSSSQAEISTIAGVAVKTSVSVSLPISNNADSNSSDSIAGPIPSTNLTAAEVPASSLPVHKDVEQQSSIPPTQSSTTASTRFRIRKPKLKITNDDETEPPRTRKPFTPSLQRSTSTVGPPVSIFKKARTRLASITSSTTARPFPQFSTIRIHYASRIPGIVPGGELLVSTELITTTVPTTTETEEPFFFEPFSEVTQVPVVSSEDNITLVKVGGCIVVEKGLRWLQQLEDRRSPQYKERADFMRVQLERLFRTSPIGTHLWKVEIDGFDKVQNSKSVAVDFFLYLVKSDNDIPPEDLVYVFHDKLKNNTFSRFRVDPAKTKFDFVREEPLKAPTPSPENEPEPPIPQWAIAVIVIGAASLIFIVLFAAVTMYGRHHMRRRYSNKLNEEDSDRPSEWESKMAAAYENLAADTIYDAEDMHSDAYKKYRHSTFHGRPTKPQRADSWSSSDWSPPPRRPRPQVHRIVY